MANNNVDLVLADDALADRTAASGLGGSPLSGIALDGGFSLTVQNAFNFLVDAAGEVRNLIVRLEEADRNTGNFVQLQHAASLKIQVDMRKMINFQGGSEVDGLDDAYELRPCRLAHGENETNSVPKQNWVLSLAPALANGNGFDSNKATYDAATKKLSSHFVPVGAVIVDLPDLSAAGGSVSIKTSGGEDATFQVGAGNSKFGLSLFGKLEYDEANVTQGSGALTVDATFDPVGSVIGGAGRHDQLTISILNMENFTKAQAITINTNHGAGETGTISNANMAAPSATDADDFDLVVTLADLGGEDDATTVGGSMVSAIEASVSGQLLTAWEVTVGKIGSSAGSELSGFLRSLAHADGAAAAGRTAEHPLLEGETFIIRKTADITVNLQPFNYSFGAAASAEVSAFDFIHQLPVHAVLEHKAGSNTKVLDTETSQLLNVV